MRRGWAAVALLLAAALAGAVVVLSSGSGGRHGGSLPELPRSRVPAPFGYADNAVTQGLASPAADARLLAEGGARIARVQLDWRFVEPVRGRYRLGGFDALYRAYRRRGVRMLLIFAYAPPWAAAHACPSPCLVSPSAGHVADAARAAAVLARRYPGLAGIEIWNEPNTPYFWGGPPDAAAYARLLRACHAAIERVRPRMPVIGGAVANATSRSAVPLGRFLRDLLGRGGARWMDAVSIHAYPAPGDTTGDTAIASLAEAREALRSGGATRLPIWITEVGLSTTGPDAIGAGAQARALVALVRRLRFVRGVRAVLVHTLIEPAAGWANRETGFGVVRDDLHPKPAYCALAAAVGGAAQCENR